MINQLIQLNDVTNIAETRGPLWPKRCHGPFKGVCVPPACGTFVLPGCLAGPEDSLVSTAVCEPWPHTTPYTSL